MRNEPEINRAGFVPIHMQQPAGVSFRFAKTDDAETIRAIEFEAGVVVFAGREWRTAEGPRLAVAAVVMRGEGLFEPADAELVHRRHYPTRVLNPIADVRVRENGHFRKSLAHGAHALHVGLRRIAHA